MSKIGWFFAGVGSLLGVGLLVRVFRPAPSPASLFVSNLNSVLAARGLDLSSDPAVQSQLTSLAAVIASNPVAQAAVMSAAQNADSVQDLVPVLNRVGSSGG